MSRDIEQKIDLRLKEALIELGIDHEGALADKLGLARGTVYRVFDGFPAREATLEKIKNELKPISLNWILTGAAPKYCDDRAEAPAVEALSPIHPETCDNLGLPRKELKELIKTAVSEALFSDDRGKLIVAYLEELLDSARAGDNGRDVMESRTYRMTADSHREAIEMQLHIPEAPPDLSPDDKIRWNRNAEAINRWSCTASAQRDFGRRGVPAWALERFCREVYSFFNGGHLEDVGGLLKDFIEEGKK